MTTKNFASISQTIQISKLLEEHCTELNGYAVYEQGWDDLRVAKEVGLDTTSRVSGVRKEIVGPMKPTPKGGKSQRVADLERAIELLTNRVDALEQMIKGASDVSKG